jgi:hypothetical protein
MRSVCLGQLNVYITGVTLNVVKRSQLQKSKQPFVNAVLVYDCNHIAFST